MITEEAAEHILVDLFARRAEDCADSTTVLKTVQHRVAQRRRTRQSRPLLMIGVTAAVVVIAVISTFFIRAQQPSEVAVGVQPTPAASSHPGLDQLAGTCLDMTRVLASWGSTKAGWGGVATGSSNGTQCSHEADIISPTRPQVASSVLAGNRTVFVALSPPGIRMGFLDLSAGESAAAAAASGGNLPAGRRYFLLVAIPDDNPQAVLVAILQQFQLPG